MTPYWLSTWEAWNKEPSAIELLLKYREVHLRRKKTTTNQTKNFPLRKAQPVTPPLLHCPWPWSVNRYLVPTNAFCCCPLLTLLLHLTTVPPPLRYFRNFVHEVIQFLCWLQIVFHPKSTTNKVPGYGIKAKRPRVIINYSQPWNMGFPAPDWKWGTLITL